MAHQSSIFTTLRPHFQPFSAETLKNASFGRSRTIKGMRQEQELGVVHRKGRREMKDPDAGFISFNLSGDIGNRNIDAEEQASRHHPWKCSRHLLLPRECALSQANVPDPASLFAALAKADFRFYFLRFRIIGAKHRLLIDKRASHQGGSGKSSHQISQRCCPKHRHLHSFRPSNPISSSNHTPFPMEFQH